jgi:AraC family transcriptional regulator
VPEVWLALRRIEHWVDEGVGFELEKLAEGLPFGADRLGRLFKGATGRSPSDYFHHRRLLNAAAVLLNPRLGITEVAAHLGFADASHSGRHFKRVHGLSPRAYRRRYGL